MEQKKSKKVVLVLIILLLIALIVSVGAYAYFVTDIFKTPEELFAKYLVNNFEQLKDCNLKPFDEVFKKMEKESTEINLKMNLEDDSIGDATASLTMKTDVENERNNFNLEIETNGNYFFGFDMLLSKNVLGLKVEDLYDKYIAIENRDLKNIGTTLGLDESVVDQIPDKIEEVDTSFSDEEIEKLNNLKTKYTNKISEGIDKTGYAVEKKIQVDVNGENVTANKYALTVKSKEFLTLLSNTFKEFLEDPEFLELYDGEKSQLKELKSKNKELMTQIKKIDEEDELVIAVYESKGKTIKTEIVADENVADFTISNNSIRMNTLTDGDKASIIITNEFDGNSGDLTIEISDEANEDNNGKIIISSSKNGDDVISKLSFESEALEDMQDAYECELSFKFGDNIRIDELTDENSEIINDYTQEEWQSLLMEVMQNIYTNASSNPDTLVGMLFSQLISNSSNSLYGSSLDEENDDLYNNSLYNNDFNSYNSTEDDSFSSFDSSNYNDAYNSYTSDDDNNSFTSSLYNDNNDWNF